MGSEDKDMNIFEGYYSAHNNPVHKSAVFSYLLEVA